MRQPVDFLSLSLAFSLSLSRRGGSRCTLLGTCLFGMMTYVEHGAACGCAMSTTMIDFHVSSAWSSVVRITRDVESMLCGDWSEPPRCGCKCNLHILCAPCLVRVALWPCSLLACSGRGVARAHLLPLYTVGAHEYAPHVTCHVRCAWIAVTT